MSWLGWGEDLGEVGGPILAGSIWGTWGIAAVLGVRILLALGTEVYATVLMRAADRRAPGARHPLDRRPRTNPSRT
jgi:hypothetical protein